MSIVRGAERVRADAGYTRDVNAFTEQLWVVPKFRDMMRAGTDLGRGIRQLHALSGWAEYGYTRLSLTTGFVASALLIAPDPEIAPPPFPAFRLEFPEGFITAGENEIVGALVHHYVATSGEERISLNLSSTRVEMGAELHLAADFSNASSVPIESAPARCVQLLRALYSWLAAENTERPYLENGRAVARDAALGKPRERVFTLGRTIKISKELMAAAKDPAVGASWDAKYRYVVRGHFRNQACGAGRSQRRKIYVAAHWKGPEFADRLQHVYEPTP